MTGERGSKARKSARRNGGRQRAPDVRASFENEAHLQSLAVARSAAAGENQAFIDTVSDRGDERSAANSKRTRQ